VNEEITILSAHLVTQILLLLLLLLLLLTISEISKVLLSNPVMFF
jgi:hypothetical protein